jgi:hypothetical protein
MLKEKVVEKNSLKTNFQVAGLRNKANYILLKETELMLRKSMQVSVNISKIKPPFLFNQRSRMRREVISIEENGKEKTRNVYDGRKNANTRRN